jgi:eukaryotic-like serine/threonine-protein kinase
MSAGPIYVMMLPNGEPRRITDDPRIKYGLAFSPDGSEIAYTVIGEPVFSTYAISVFGGDPHLLLRNGAGLTWLDSGHYLYSRIRSGLHLGVVTSTTDGQNLRELYFPEHERAMAHYSFVSPNHRSALVVWMTGDGWQPCLRITLDNSAPPSKVGPMGGCTAAGWSADGATMYFAALVDGQSHLWRQPSAGGPAQQLTFGPLEESGLAIDPRDGSLITAAGVSESVLWIHDAKGEQPVSSEGEVSSAPAAPVFTAQDQFLYYLAQKPSTSSGMSLWRLDLAAGKSEVALPGVDVNWFDISPDGKQVLYSRNGGPPGFWIAPIDGSASPRLLGTTNDRWPHFGRPGEILLISNEHNSNYLESIRLDGRARTRLLPYPVHDLQSISPGRHWAISIVEDPGGIPKLMAIPLAGGRLRQLCPDYCVPSWASSGQFLYIPLEPSSRLSAGRSMAIPLGPNEELPELPATGIKPDDSPNVVPGARIVEHGAIVGGKDPSYFAFVKTSVHQNLYRIARP